jgi:hypothetical protein
MKQYVLKTVAIFVCNRAAQWLRYGRAGEFILAASSYGKQLARTAQKE